MSNKIIIITGPSGSGKTTISNKLIEMFPDSLNRIKTYTTRSIREQEDYESYNLITLESFKELIDTNSFVEYEEVYAGIFYGTLKESITSALYNNDNKYSIICMDVQGALKLKNILGNRCITVFCNPQSWDVVYSRIIERNVDINKEERILKYKFEMSFEKNFEISINTSIPINQTLESFKESVRSKANHKTLIVNLYGGPGTGKSTMAAALFSELKFRNITAELITEFAKDKVWEESIHLLNDQLFIFANQYHKFWSVLDKVDVIVTDSPLLMSLAYTKKDNFKLIELVKQHHFENKNLEVFLKREKPYVTIGRIQSEQKAKEKDLFIEDILNENLISYYSFRSNKSSVNEILELILEKIK